MALQDVSAKVTVKDKDGVPTGETREDIIQYDFGDDLSSMVAKFGDEAVFTNAAANMKVALQGRMRGLLLEGKDCQLLTTMWKPGVAASKLIDPKAALKAILSGLSEEERAVYIKDLLESSVS